MRARSQPAPPPALPAACPLGTFPHAALASAALLLAALLVSPAASAGGYVALDGSSVTLGARFDDDLNPRGGRLRLGVRVSNVFDVEVQAGLSADRDSEPFDRFEVSWGGAYLKAHLPVGERSALFALGGVAGVAIAQSIGEGEFSDDRAGFSFGAGLETGLSERLDLSADWMRYVDGEGAFESVDAVSLGLKLYF